MQALDTALRQSQVFDLHELAKEAMASYPNEEFGRYYMAEYYLLAWEHTSALAAFGELVERNPENALYKQRLAVAKLKNQDVEGGIALFEELLTQAPDDLELCAIFGREVIAAAWQKESVDKAVQALSRVIAARPDDLALYADRAAGYQNLGEYDKALADFDIILNREPQNIQAYQRRIQINTFANNDDAVIADYNKLLEINPEDTYTISNFGFYYKNKGAWEAAEQCFTRQIAIEQKNDWQGSAAIFARGEVYLAQQKYELALADFNAALAQNKDYTEALARRAEAHLALGNEAQFLADTEAALKSNFFSKHDLLIKRANFYLKKKEWDKANADFSKFLTDDSLSFYKNEGYFGLGVLAKEQDDIETACEYWQQAKTEYHPQADEMIRQYCTPYLEAEQLQKRDAIASQFANEYDRNTQSPVLQQIFGHIWKVDVSLSLEKSPTLGQLPQGLVAFFMEAFRNITLSVSERALVLHNPLSDDIEAYYRVEREENGFVQIFAQPTNNKEPRTLIFSMDEQYLRVSGLMSGVGEDKNAIFMYFRHASDTDLTAEDKEALNLRMKHLAENFLGELLHTVVQGIENVFGLNPQGEAASDEPNYDEDMPHE